MERFVNCFGLLDMIADMIKAQVSQLMNLATWSVRQADGKWSVGQPVSGSRGGHVTDGLTPISPCRNDERIIHYY